MGYDNIIIYIWGSLTHPNLQVNMHEIKRMRTMNYNITLTQSFNEILERGMEITGHK